jgi:hypothetical protein
MTSTDERRMLSIKPVLLNPPNLRRDNLDSDSNVTEENDPQSAKHLSPKISTDTRRMISTKSVSRNASISNRGNLEGDSSVTEESD